jgi:hypothetical protein
VELSREEEIWRRGQLPRVRVGEEIERTRGARQLASFRWRRASKHVDECCAAGGARVRASKLCPRKQVNGLDIEWLADVFVFIFFAGANLCLQIAGSCC